MNIMSRFSPVIRVITLVLFGISTPIQAGEFDKGLLWQISGKHNDASFLFGTVHSDDPSVTTLPVQVQSAMQQARHFCAELDLNMSTMLQAQVKMMLPADKQLQDLIGQRNFRQSVNLMANYGVPEMIVGRMKPWAVAAQLMMPVPQTNVFLDLKLYQQAQSRGIPTCGLEQVEEQLAVFENMSVAQQINFLEQAIREYAELPVAINTMLNLYRNRDLAGLQAFSDRQMQKTDKSLASYMEKNLINNRNYLMVDRMKPHMVNGKAFFAVGALHLPGEHGILNILKKQGYQLQRLY